MKAATRLNQETHRRRSRGGSAGVIIVSGACEPSGQHVGFEIGYPCGEIKAMKCNYERGVPTGLDSAPMQEPSSPLRSEMNQARFRQRVPEKQGLDEIKKNIKHCISWTCTK